MFEGWVITYRKKDSLIPLRVRPLINHQAIKVSSPNRGLIQTEQGAPQPRRLPVPHALLPSTGRNFYKERRDGVTQGYATARRQISEHQSTAVTPNYKKKANGILEAFIQLALAAVGKVQISFNWYETTRTQEDPETFAIMFCLA